MYVSVVQVSTIRKEESQTHLRSCPERSFHKQTDHKTSMAASSRKKVLRLESEQCPSLYCINSIVY